jgi:pantoate--beta-alanine ligase
VKTSTKRQELLQQLNGFRAEGKSIGFVPTMGALHKGHIALVQRALAENQVVVVSIFVNPTQFNNPDDLVNYPRTLDVDSHLLEQAGCNILFFPEINEMYPDGFVEPVHQINLGGLDKVMEGAHRPGHFAGVIQVVEKLFDAVGPCKAYFGEKDFQQLAVIRKMVKEWKLPVEIIGCPIVREEDGLAMSSRNVRLTLGERKIAPLISKSLFHAKEMWVNHSATEIREMIIKSIDKEKSMQLEYFEIADAETLQPAGTDQKKNVVACIAVHLGNVRLIDNVILG